MILAPGSSPCTVVVRLVILQPEIQQHHIRLGFPRLAERLFDIRGGGQDLEARLGVNQRGETLAQQSVVVDEDQRNGRG